MLVLYCLASCLILHIIALKRIECTFAPLLLSSCIAFGLFSLYYFREAFYTPLELFLSMYKIGNVKLDNQLILAPMAAVNCGSFRLLCKESGAGLVTTAMIVANQIVASPDKLIERTCFLKDEKPLSIQLVGSDSKLMADATSLIEDHADIIDVNLGCPENDILALKAGSFFVKHPEQIQKAVKPVIDNTNKPVTAKIRTGWDEKSINTLEIVKILEDLGVSAITIHGRTKAQKYTGKADWNEIKKAKEIANIPIIGNGDVGSPEKAKEMLERTNCDFVMIGRAAMGNPLIFRTCREFLETGKYNEVSVEEKMNNLKKFMEYYDKYENQRSFSELRQQVMWFTKGLKGSKKLRNDLVKASSLDEINELVS